MTESEIHDAGGVEPLQTMPSEPRPNIFMFPQGVRAGLFFHELLEHVDFNGSRPADRQEVIGRMLKKFGYEDVWRGVVNDMLTKVLSAPMESGDTAIRLDGISLKNQVRELEFYFPLRHLTPEMLENTFRRNGGPRLPARVSTQLGRLGFSPVEGFMRGFIDLVFFSGGRYYLLDWKSNHLGFSSTDYRGQRLMEAMIENNYFLQYHLYTLALHRYLSVRVSGYRYDRHFGGVFYVFLRGVDPQYPPGNGIFTDRPAAELIEALDQALVGKPNCETPFCAAPDGA